MALNSNFILQGHHRRFSEIIKENHAATPQLNMQLCPDFPAAFHPLPASLQTCFLILGGRHRGSKKDRLSNVLHVSVGR
jgi:hypothetical protein